MRLRGLELGRVGMKNLKNSHNGMCCAKISHKGMCCANFAQGDMLCEFRIGHYSPAQMRNCGFFKWQQFLVFEGGKCWLR